MPAAYPKPDAERVNRNTPAFGWVDLPAAGRQGPPPRLPGKLSEWHPETRAWWKRVWALPQAVMWDQSGETMVPWARIMEAVHRGADAIKASVEIRQHQDRHGLNPKAMLQLRWRLVEAVPEPEVAPRRRRGTASAMKDRLTVVE